MSANSFSLVLFGSTIGVILGLYSLSSPKLWTRLFNLKGVFLPKMISVGSIIFPIWSKVLSVGWRFFNLFDYEKTTTEEQSNTVDTRKIKWIDSTPKIDWTEKEWHERFNSWLNYKNVNVKFRAVFHGGRVYSIVADEFNNCYRLLDFKFDNSIRKIECIAWHHPLYENEKRLIKDVAIKLVDLSIFYQYSLNDLGINPENYRNNVATNCVADNVAPGFIKPETKSKYNDDWLFNPDTKFYVDEQSPGNWRLGANARYGYGYGRVPFADVKIKEGRFDSFVWTHPVRYERMVELFSRLKDKFIKWVHEGLHPNTISGMKQGMSIGDYGYGIPINDLKKLDNDSWLFEPDTKFYIRERSPDMWVLGAKKSCWGIGDAVVNFMNVTFKNGKFESVDWICPAGTDRVTELFLRLKDKVFVEWQNSLGSIGPETTESMKCGMPLNKGFVNYGINIDDLKTTAVPQTKVISVYDIDHPQVQQPSHIVKKVATKEGGNNDSWLFNENNQFRLCQHNGQEEIQVRHGICVHIIGIKSKGSQFIPINDSVSANKMKLGKALIARLTVNWRTLKELGIHDINSELTKILQEFDAADKPELDAQDELSPERMALDKVRQMHRKYNKELFGTIESEKPVQECVKFYYKTIPNLIYSWEPNTNMISWDGKSYHNLYDRNTIAQRFASGIWVKVT